MIFGLFSAGRPGQACVLFVPYGVSLCSRVARQSQGLFFCAICHDIAPAIWSEFFMCFVSPWVTVSFHGVYVSILCAVSAEGER